jgi:hypothetical protein
MRSGAVLSLALLAGLWQPLAAAQSSAPGASQSAASSAAQKPPALDPTLTIDCLLRRAGENFSGNCMIPCSANALAINFDGVDKARACASPTRTVPARLSRTAMPGRWLGTMVGVQPEDPTRFEIVPDAQGGSSVGRLPYGWFRVSELIVVGDSLSLQLDAQRQMRPTSDDLAILDRATALIPSAAVWNKNDNRECAPKAEKLSLFCALMQATTEISGGVHYRQPAMQAVREELNRVDPLRIKTHRIMDFNNHPDTKLDEIHALLKRARARVSVEVR